MRKLSKILTCWIPVKKARRASRDWLYQKLSSLIPLKKDWVIFYDTFSKNGNGDSIRPLVEELRKRKPDFKFFFVSKEERSIEMADEVLVIGSKRYDYVIERAKYLISPMDLPTTKHKNQIWIMTWHGSPIKKLYLSRAKNDEMYSYVRNFKNCDYFCNASKTFLPILMEAFDLPEEKFINSGLPRNEILITKNNEAEINKIKEKLNIPLDKKVLFYCPTWRRYDWKQPMPFDLNNLEKMLRKDYIILLRSHVGKHDWVDSQGRKISLSENQFAYDVGNWENISELYLVSDVLITDYSSSIFDFSILERPQILYAYDFEQYEKEFGLYFDYKSFSPFPIAYNEGQLIQAILAQNLSSEELKNFREKYAEFELGTEVEQIINLITEGK